MIRGTCPACGRTYTLDDEFAGRTGRCQACGAVVTVPAQPNAESAKPADETGIELSPAGPPPAEAAGPTATDDAPAEQGATLQSLLDEWPGAAPPQAESAEAAPPAEAGDEAPRPAAAIQEPAEEAEPVRPLEHFGRLSYEPEHGPTAIEGSWLKEEGEEPVPEAPPSAQQVLSGKLVALADEAPDEIRRPPLLTIACTALALLGLGFAGLFAVRGGTLGIAVGALGFVLAALGFVRLWTGHMDGLVPAVLHCLCVAGTVLFVAFAGEDAASPTLGWPAIALLAGAGVALILVVLASATTSGYLYLHKHS